MDLSKLTPDEKDATEALMKFEESVDKFSLKQKLKAWRGVKGLAEDNIHDLVHSQCQMCRFRSHPSCEAPPEDASPCPHRMPTPESLEDEHFMMDKRGREIEVWYKPAGKPVVHRVFNEGVPGADGITDIMDIVLIEQKMKEEADAPLPTQP